MADHFEMTAIVAEMRLNDPRTHSLDRTECDGCHKVTIEYYDPYGTAALALCSSCNGSGFTAVGPILDLS